MISPRFGSVRSFLVGANTPRLDVASPPMALEMLGILASLSKCDESIPLRHHRSRPSRRSSLAMDALPLITKKWSRPSVAWTLILDLVLVACVMSIFLPWHAHVRSLRYLLRPLQWNLSAFLDLTLSPGDSRLGGTIPTLPRGSCLVIRTNLLVIPTRCRTVAQSMSVALLVVLWQLLWEERRTARRVWPQSRCCQAARSWLSHTPQRRCAFNSVNHARSRTRL